MDHPRRRIDEATLVAALREIFDDLAAAVRELRVDWESWRQRIAAALQKKLEETALFAYLLWLSSEDVRRFVPGFQLSYPFTGAVGLSAPVANYLAGRRFPAWANATQAGENFAGWAWETARTVATAMVQNLRRAYDRIRAAIANETASVDSLATLVKPQRAKMVAATEITRSFQHGLDKAVEAFEAQHGRRIRKIWRTQKDERVCPICAPLDRQPSEDWESRFPKGPPAHPVCRCYTSLEIL